MKFDYEKNSDYSMSKYLIDPKYYIDTCIYNSAGMKAPVNMLFDKANYIDYYMNNKTGVTENLKSFENGFVISKINSANKYSKRYLNCTGIIAIGESSINGENISFLSHQNTKSFLDKNKLKNIFKERIIESLIDLKNKSKEGTIDLIIFGGDNENLGTEYKDTV